MISTMTEEELEAALQQFFADGGEVIQLREATKKDQEKAARRAYHEDKALCGNQRSIEIVERESLFGMCKLVDKSFMKCNIALLSCF